MASQEAHKSIWLRRRFCFSSLWPNCISLFIIIDINSCQIEWAIKKFYAELRAELKNQDVFYKWRVFMISSFHISIILLSFLHYSHTKWHDEEREYAMKSNILHFHFSFKSCLFSYGRLKWWWEVKQVFPFQKFIFKH